MKRRTPEEKLSAISEIDRTYWARGMTIAGIDEAGCGPLAGPVAAACVIMPPEPLLLHVNDSKQLSESRREALYAQIMETALYARVAFSDVAEIDELNIAGATRLAMERAAGGAKCDLFLIDALEGVQLDGEMRAIVRGDALVYSIAAASILAKVERDRRMRQLDAEYPQYGFAKHKGYGTREHIEALRRFGPCPAHRRLFIRNFMP